MEKFIYNKWAKTENNNNVPWLRHTISIIREEPKMSCNCNPNKSIRCTVTQCKNHCKDTDYCSLSSIVVGTHESNPTMVECTDCTSFQLK